MSAFSGAQKRRELTDLHNTQKKRTLTLQVEKRMKKVRVPAEDSYDEEVEDKDLAMIIKTMKKFWKKKGRSKNSRGNSSRGSYGDSPHQGISRK